jgi:pimeloyl-ACP methyl ester carboxylesterase
VAPFFRGDCCVTAVDLSGHGESGRRPVYTFDDWSKEIAAVAANTGANQAPPVILAHSLGGLATFCAAAKYGDGFEGIIVIDSPVYSLAPEQQASRNREAFGPLRTYPSKEAALARFRTVPDQPVMLPFVVEHIKKHSLRRTDDGDGWTWKFDPKFFERVGHVGPETLAAIPCRVAVLRAENGLVTEDIGHLMYQALGHTAPVIEIPLAYHHVMLDQPIALVTAVRSLLADWRHSYSIRAPG